MSHLVPVDTAPGFEPRKTEAPEAIRIDGAPRYRTWDLDTATAEAAKWGTVRTGIWEATPGTTISEKGDKFEFCHILSGRVRITEDGGAPREFGPGDSFVMKPGFRGQWQTLETVCKIFVIAT